jgi:hypothetical protein
MIGEIIVQLLTANADLLALVPAASIFPYVAEEKTDLPLLIYAVDNLDATYSKDGWVKDLITFHVMTFSETYDDLQAIVLQVRKALELKHTSATNRIIVTGMKEGFNLTEQVFLNNMDFAIEVINN